MFASTSVLILLNIGDAATSRDRTPAAIVHICDGILDAQFLVLIKHLFVQSNVFDIQVVQSLLTRGNSARNLLDLTKINLGHDQLCDTLSAEKVLAT